MILHKYHLDPCHLLQLHYDVNIASKKNMYLPGESYKYKVKD